MDKAVNYLKIESLQGLFGFAPIRQRILFQRDKKDNNGMDTGYDYSAHRFIQMTSVATFNIIIHY